MSVQCGYHSSVHSIPRNSAKDGEKKDGNWDESFDATAAFLGPNLWDKTVPYNDDFKMEYMDLDEFFTENGIAVPNPEMTAAARNHHQHHPHHPHSHQGQHHNHHPHHQHQQQQQQQQQQQPPPQQPQQQEEQDHHHSPHPHHQSPHPSHQQSPLPPTPVTPTPPRLQLVPPQPKPTPPPDSTSTPPTPPTSPFEKPVQIKEEISAENNINFGDRACAKGSAYLIENDLRVKLELKFSPADLALATSPGEERFDPISHTFSEDELKPQPMVKKSKKQLVPNDMKDEKYWARRKKNNMAAKRSRDARRVKENQIAMRASFLERENTTLRKEIEVVQRENSALKEKLAKYERC